MWLSGPPFTLGCGRTGSMEAERTPSSVRPLEVPALARAAGRPSRIVAAFERDTSAADLDQGPLVTSQRKQSAPEPDSSRVVVEEVLVAEDV